MVYFGNLREDCTSFCVAVDVLVRTEMWDMFAHVSTEPEQTSRRNCGKKCP